MKKIVYIAIEVKKREFTAKCLLATVLAKEGFTVILCESSDARRRASIGTPGILLDKDYWESRKYTWELIKKNGGKVYAWDEEGVVESFKHASRLKTGISSINIASGIMLWGSVQKNNLEQLGVLSEKVIVVGNPRMDLLGANLEYFYSDKIRSIKNKYGKYILINLNFCKDGGVRRLSDIVANENDGSMAESDKLLLESRTMKYQELLDLYCKMIDELCEAIPNKIVLRLHPKELAVDWWKNRFLSHNNLIVNSEGDANLWVSACEVMIHAGCTTSIEAYISRQPSIIYNPIDSLNTPLFSELSHRVKTVSDVVETVQRLLNGEMGENVFFTQERDNIISEYIYIPDKRTSSELIAEILSDNIFEEGEIKENCDSTCKSLFRMIKRCVASHLKMQGNVKFGYTRKKEVETLIDASKRMMGYDCGFRVKHIGHNVFSIVAVE